MKTRWEQIVLVIIALATRIYLLGVYDVELSQDGFEAVRTLTIWQTQGVAALPRDLLDRALLHPLYMLALTILRLLTPVSIDFYLTARFLSTIFACVAIVLLFEFTRRAFGNLAAWVPALLLAFAPTFLWESATILSSTLFLALYIAVLFALFQSHYRLASLLAFLSALVRYEGLVLIALTFVFLFARDFRQREFQRSDWIIFAVCVLGFPLTLLAGSLLATGNPLQFIGAQSMASIWLRFMAPGDFFKRGAFFITQYSTLFPTPIVWLGVAGIIVALIAYRTRATGILLLTAVLYLFFFETLVWLDYTTLETRFLMYPGLPLLVFAGVALSEFCNRLSQRIQPSPQKFARWIFPALISIFVAVLCVMSYQQAELGFRYIYNSQASMREMADELASIFPTHQPVNVLAYGGTSGALDMFARQRGIELAFTEFRYAPDENPEQYIIDNDIQFIIYPVGNAFAKAKYPYLAHFDDQTQRGVTFKPITQFATSTDNQLYSIWAVQW